MVWPCLTVIWTCWFSHPFAIPCVDEIGMPGPMSVFFSFMTNLRLCGRFLLHLLSSDFSGRNKTRVNEACFDQYSCEGFFVHAFLGGLHWMKKTCPNQAAVFFVYACFCGSIVVPIHLLSCTFLHVPCSQLSSTHFSQVFDAWCVARPNTAFA